MVRGRWICEVAAAARLAGREFKGVEALYAGGRLVREHEVEIALRLEHDRT